MCILEAKMQVLPFSPKLHKQKILKLNRRAMQVEAQKHEDKNSELVELELTILQLARRPGKLAWLVMSPDAAECNGKNWSIRLLRGCQDLNLGL